MERRRSCGTALLLPSLLLLACRTATTHGQTTPTTVSGDVLAAATPLFSMTNGFVDLVYKSGNNTAILDKALSINWSGSVSGSDAWELIKVIIGAYSGFAACVIIGLLFIVLVPLTGLICCCCRCCGKCGGSTPIEDPPHAKAKRFCCCALVFIFTTLAVGGTIGVFLSNQAIANGLRAKDGLLDHAQTGLNGLVNAVNSTAEDLLAMPATRLGEAEIRVLSAIDDAGNTIIGDVLNHTSVTDLLQTASDVIGDVPALNTSLVSTSDKFKELQSLYNSLIASLSNVKSNITTECERNGGSSSNCNNQSSVIAVPDNGSLNWVQPVAQAVSSIISELSKLNSLTNLTVQIANVNKSAIREVQQKLADAKQVVKSLFDSADNATLAYTSSFQSSVSQTLNSLPTLNTPEVTSSVQKYSDYVRYVGIAIGSVFILLVLLNYLGLCFGICGGRPGFDASSCNKGIGARLLLAVFGLYVLLSWLLMVLTTILFLVSTAKILCLAVDEPESRLPVDRLRQVPLNIGGQTNLTVATIAEALIACKSNKSLYEAVLKQIPALNSTLSNVQAQINRTTVTSAISNITFDNINIDLPSDNTNSTLQQLNEVMDYLANVTLEDHVKQLQDQLGASNLSQAALQLAPKYPDQAAELTKIQDQIVGAIGIVLSNLSSSVSDIQKRQSIVGRLRNLTSLAVNLQSSINKTAIIQEAIVKVANQVLSIIDQEIIELQNQIMNLPCLPVYQQFQSTADVVCTEALNPLNGMWFCVGWCLVIFIPNIAFALVLVSLYRREEPYSASHELAEFEAQPDSFSVFQHHDNIPLESSRNGAKRY